MQYFCYILSVYLIGLAMLPCADAGHMSLLERDAVTFDLHTDGNTHQHDDVCSPLCYCACCGITSLTSPAIVAPVGALKVQLPELLVKRAQVYSQGYSGSVFRPPVVG